MTTDQYLENVLSQQRLTNSELNELRAHRADVQTVLEDHFSESNPGIRYAGSYKKKTMIRDAYDLDVACYFGHEDTAAGQNLERDLRCLRGGAHGAATMCSGSDPPCA